MRPSLVRPPCALKKVIVGVAARPLLSTVTPGIAFRIEPYARVAGSASIADELITVSRRVSCTAPTLRSNGIVSVTEPVTSMPSRRIVANPGSDTVIEYVPGRRSTMRYRPALSVTADRTFSMSTGLDASTVTPGRTAPDVSFTVPVIVAWANAAAGATTVHANTTAILARPRISDLLRKRQTDMTKTAPRVSAFKRASWACQGTVPLWAIDLRALLHGIGSTAPHGRFRRP